MGTNLYFLSNGKAQNMSEKLYEKEDNLQSLIADNPQLLLRGNSGDSQRLMLVGREFAVKDTEDGPNVYSLDHLFLDQSGVPVLVEVKRSTDTRIRREVVAQIMDYASRARTWDIDQIREQFYECNQDEDWFDQYNTEDYWQRVAANLKAEHLRLVFAADKIPVQLKTLITFMDRSMSSIEVYGVEIRQFKTGNTTMLTSNIIEDTTPKEKTPSHQVIEWDINSFTAFMNNENLGYLLPIMNDILEYAKTVSLDYGYGKGYKYPFIRVKYGNANFFKITPWLSSSGMKCIIEMSVTKFVSNLSSIITEELLREIMTDLPERDKVLASGMVWESPQYIFYDLCAFKQESVFQAFKNSLRKLMETISQ